MQVSSISFSTIGIPDPYQHKTVNPGERIRVWYYRVGAGYTAFISKMAYSWYPDTFCEWEVDGKLKEKLERTIEITEPDEYNPPIISEKQIEFWVTNNALLPIEAEILCDGVLCRPIGPA